MKTALRIIRSFDQACDAVSRWSSMSLRGRKLRDSGNKYTCLCLLYAAISSLTPHICPVSYHGAISSWALRWKDWGQDPTDWRLHNCCQWILAFRL